METSTATVSFSYSTPRLPPASPSLVALLELVPPSPILSSSDISPSLTLEDIPILLLAPTRSSESIYSLQQHFPPLNPNPRNREFDPSGSTDNCDLYGSLTNTCTERLDINSAGIRDSFGIFDHRSKHDKSMLLSFCAKPLRQDSGVASPLWNFGTNELSRQKAREAELPRKSKHESEECLSYNQGVPMQHLGVRSGQEEGYVSRCTLPSLKQCTDISATQCRDLTLSQAFPQGVYVDDNEDSDEINPIYYQIEQASSSNSVRSLSRRPTTLHVPCISSGNHTTHKWKESQGKVSSMTQYPKEMLQPQFGGQPHGDGIKYLCRRTPSSSGTYRSASSPFHLHDIAPGLSTSTYGPRDEKYEWLQNSTTVTLLIDQEGFRTVEPIFKLTKERRRKLWDLGGMVESELVIFKPVKRETFRFHYAPFDGLPTLRRLTINNDDTRDHLSRQANLRLRSTGIYAVHGSETPTVISSCSPGGLGISTKLRDDIKLFWQFDYSIEDHLTEYTGRFVDGEKVLVPLAFSCSPQLLHPSQGKKITVMHIVKKTITTKLSAELLVKSSALSSSFTAPSCSAAGWTDSTTTRIPPTMKNNLLLNTHGWNSYCRAQSSPREAPEITSIHQAPSSADNKTVSSRKARPRRASSASESHVTYQARSSTRPNAWFRL